MTEQSYLTPADADAQGQPMPAASASNEPVGVQHHDDTETIARLAALKPMDYDRLRKEEAKAMGVQVKTLDDLVASARNESRGAERMPFQDVEPDPDPVEPALLLNEVATTIRRFIVMDSEQADTVALWVVHTYLTDVADTSPLLIINAPEKACAAPSIGLASC